MHPLVSGKKIWNIGSLAMPAAGVKYIAASVCIINRLGAIASQLPLEASQSNNRLTWSSKRGWEPSEKFH